MATTHPMTSYRNPSRGPEDSYSVILFHNGRAFRVFAPLSKNRAAAIRAKCLRKWGLDRASEYNQQGYYAMVVQCWTDFGAQEREENKEETG